MPIPLPHPLALRPVRPADDAFLFELYASTRADEMAACGWSHAQIQVFLLQQFKARKDAYRTSFPGAIHSLVSLGGKKIGALIVHHRESEIRLVDVALVPSHRSAGWGRKLLEGVLASARNNGKAVHLHVLTGNRAFGLYSRLGFVPTGVRGAYTAMIWQYRNEE